MSQSWKKCCCNGWTYKSGQFLLFWLTFRQARIFPENSTPSVLGTYGPSTSCKIYKKYSMTQQTELFQAIWPTFEKARIFPKNLALSVLSAMVRQLHAKYEKKPTSQLSWQKSSSNKQMDKLGYFGLFWPIFRQERIFPKNLAPLVMSTYGSTTSCKMLKKINEPILKKVLW